MCTICWKAMRRGRWLLPALLAALLALSGIRSVWAHGGGEPVITRGAVGEYLLYAWLNPASPRAGDTLHLTIGVTQPGADGAEVPVTDATVLVRAVGEGDPYSVAAEPGADAGGLYFEADMELPEGLWTLEVEVTPLSASTSGGTASFPLAVQPASSTRWWLVVLGSAAVVTGVVLYAVAIVRGRRTIGVAPQ
jgi:hypothetical protein